jgi:hypothetical protein
MRILSSLILLAVLCGKIFAQSPHGDEFNFNCEDCHTTDGWKINKKPLLFNHDTTSFRLEGQHKQVDCRLCHISLVFSDAEQECRYCHTDMHYQTVGFECERCHTPKSWIVENITQIHQVSRFPLVGAHVTADCYDCHPSESLLRFEPLGVECYDCHQDDYAATTNPNHAESNFSTTCDECHLVNSFAWTGADFTHDFFPLSGVHDIADCKICHTTNDYSTTSAECVSCHLQDYNDASSPDHNDLAFSTNCTDCHTTSPDWKPARFDEHDALFPIYSGTHNGEWNTCAECHTLSGNYGVFSCIDCHEHNQGDTDNEHDEVSGYTYTSIACFECHPTGTGEGSFNHNASNFPLTGAHLTTDCSGCHANGYSGTPTVCFACHENDYTQTSNPAHNSIGIATDCETCHTTEPDWKPALFPNHDDTYPLLGAHAEIANNCFTCHEGNYVNTPNYCFSCHSDDYNQTQNPPHATAQYSTNCEVCHDVNAWVPSIFNHNNSNFPLTGAHTTTECNGCHANGYSGTPTVCFACHETDFNQSADPGHVSIGIPNDCETCHTTNPDWQPATFPIHNDYYPLQGAHATIASDCFTCHEGSYINTPNQCFGCHSDDYNQANDPDHVAAQFPTECESCHTVAAWTPATFDHDGQYFPIYSGNHQGTWDACSECHTNPGNYSVFTCLTCHEQGETGDEHNGVGGYTYNSQACFECHPTGSAAGSFDHNNSNFPLTGGHLTAECLDCHANGYVGTPTVCNACHESDFNQSSNPNHNAIGIPDDCDNCHTTNPGWQPATFAIHNNYYPLTGAHTSVATDCFICHEGDYNNTPNACAGCHLDNYNQSANPDHDALGIGTNCETCHTTSPDWQPASFPIHNEYWVFTGAHISISNDCDACHSGNYNNTTNTCFGCHLDDYNQTNDPNHATAQFPTDCELCHTTAAWIPSTFDHDGLYFPIYSGSHQGEWNSCSECHPNPSNYLVFTCLTCHEQGETNGEHEGVSGYSYNSNACLTCHPDGEAGDRKFKFN